MAKTLKSVVGGAPFSMIPTLLPLEVQSNIPRLLDIDNMFGTDATSERRLGHRWEWQSITGFGESFTDWINITGPGVMQFLAIYCSVNGGDNDDPSFQLLIDGNTVIPSYVGWSSSTELHDGYVLVGEWIPAATGGVPEYGGLVLEPIPFETSFILQIKNQASGGTHGNTYTAAYRRYAT